MTNCSVCEIVTFEGKFLRAKLSQNPQKGRHDPSRQKQPKWKLIRSMLDVLT